MTQFSVYFSLDVVSKEYHKVLKLLKEKIQFLCFTTICDSKQENILSEFCGSTRHNDFILPTLSFFIHNKAYCEIIDLTEVEMNIFFSFSRVNEESEQENTFGSFCIS